MMTKTININDMHLSIFVNSVGLLIFKYASTIKYKQYRCHTENTKFNVYLFNKAADVRYFFMSFKCPDFLVFRGYKLITLVGRLVTYSSASSSGFKIALGLRFIGISPASFPCMVLTRLGACWGLVF
jgi:hypothetical protein